MATIILIIIGFYRVANIVMEVVANLFYSDKGYILNQIATFSKFWVLIATIIGVLIGGVLSSKYNNHLILLLGAILAVITNLLFALLVMLEPKSIYLLTVIVADNISSGIASFAFVVFLGSGTIVDDFGCFNFFIATTLIGVPIIILIIAFKNKLYNN